MLLLKFNLFDIAYFTVMYLVLMLVLGYLTDVLERLFLRGSPPYVAWRGWSWLDLVLSPPVSPLVDAVYGVVVIPLVEEGLLIGIPLVVFNSSLLALFGALLFSLLHAVPIVEACRRFNLPREYAIKALLLDQLYHLPLAVLSWVMWTSGYAWLSIILHMINNALATWQQHSKEREKVRKVQEMLTSQKRRHAPYVESYVPYRDTVED